MRLRYNLSSWALLCCLLGHASYTESLECFSCSNIGDANNCTHSLHCSSGQICYMNSATVGQSNVHTLGCIDKHQCGVHVTGASGLVGRDISERQSDQCHECCSTDYCNKHLCEHLTPKTCIDDEKIDCGFLNTVTNICQDIHHAKTICPKFCDLCSLVDGVWSGWSAWTACDVTCENGTQTRTRTCTNPPPSNGGLNCSGNARDVKGCQRQLCPVQGGWSGWSVWESCSVTCDAGIQTRHRNCSNPYPLRYGDHCFGDPVGVRLCTPGPCANGGWSGWGTWGSCSASCGGGVRTQSRTCTNPRPSFTGKFCDGKDTQLSPCNINSCIPNVVFNAYYLTDMSPSINQTMIFTKVLVNEADAYNKATGEFTAPIDGMYSFSAQICIVGGQQLYFDIKVGGTTYASAYAYDASNAQCPSITTAARVRKNEKVIVQWTTTSYASHNYITQSANYRNYFTGTLIHPQI